MSEEQMKLVQGDLGPAAREHANDRELSPKMCVCLRSVSSFRKLLENYCWI